MNILIVHTPTGPHFARRIRLSLDDIASKRGLDMKVELTSTSAESIRRWSRDHTPGTSLIHARAANPGDVPFMKALYEAEEMGIRVVNRPEVLTLTSDKGACALALQDKFPHPISFVVRKHHLEEWLDGSRLDDDIVSDFEQVILKPETSMSQGASVIRVETAKFLYDPDKYGDMIPGDRVVVQEYVPYTAIYRVIVIGGTALPYVFVDKPSFHPDNWKVSVCLNKNQQIILRPDLELLRLAEHIQTEIGGEINFIDIFETKPGKFVISEINTACNLHIHEMLAKKAGLQNWNIHRKIAKYLIYALTGENL